MDKNMMTGEQFHKLANETLDESQSVRALTNYLGSVENTQQGWHLLADQFVGHVKTLMGGKLGERELRTLQQPGELQKLIGRFRKEVVGGGVMTEQDALRVIAAVGGDVNMWRNRDVVARLIEQMMGDKIQRFELNRLHYNIQRGYTGRGAYPKLDPVIPILSPDNADKEFEGIKSGKFFLDPNKNLRRKP